MIKTLTSISEKAFVLADITFTKDQLDSEWLGAVAASSNKIEEVEARLGILLPEDYKQFIQLSSGFGASSSVDPSFGGIEKIDFLKNVDQFQIDLWSQAGTIEVGEKLERSIIVAGIGEDQYFLLIPPQNAEPWGYWKFASWIPGESIFEGIESYFLGVESFLKDEIEAESR